MEKKIKMHLDLVERANTWVLETKSMEGTKGKNAYRKLLNYKWTLNKKKVALESNPAAAIYGESQTGKSYLVSSLLSEGRTSFKIFDGHGNDFDFKLQINPRGNEIESTSVVTRFSTKNKWINKDYPVIAKLLSPTDIIIVICEAYYNNLKANKTTKFEELKENIETFEKSYAVKNECQNWILEENVLFEIKDYFYNNFSATVYHNIEDAGFFEKISAIVTKIAPEEWKDVFSLLWNFNPQLTKLFNDLICQYKKLNFADTIYLPIDSVLRYKGTLLDVSRLDEIYENPKGQEPEYCPETSILYTDEENNEQTINFSKPYLCALTAELIFILPEAIKNSKNFLDKTDLIDFPGIRRFESTSEDNISNDALTKLLRRGRVDYLFNKYSDFERINVLLFCQKHSQSVQSVMPEKLNRWISNMIGEKPEDRDNFQSPIPPLFVISTWFNKDLEFDFASDRPDNNSSLNARWHQRFITVLEGEIFKADTYPWLREWTTSNPNFQNIYLLRDFDKSSETNSQIFKGYNDKKTEEEEIKPVFYPHFREDLRKSFLDFAFVKRHFENPAISWDRAASINEDGTQLIIDHMTIAANNINDARREKNIRELNFIGQDILNELKKYYHDSDSDAQLKKAIETAGSIQAKLDITFGKNPYFFGQMMKEFMLNESVVYKLYLEIIRDIEREDVVNMDKYSGIRMNVPELNPNDNFDTNLERLRAQYIMPTKEECKNHFEAEEIDLEELFYGNHKRVMNFSDVLSNALESFWFEQYMQENRQNLSKIFSDSGLQDIQDMLRRLFRKLQISEVIAGKIRRYVDGNRKIEDAYEMIADISAEILNKFINTIGMEYFSESDLADLKQANEENSLGLILEHNNLQFEQNSPAEVAELITKMGNLPELLNQNPLPQEAKRLPNYRNYIIWYDLLKVGFVSVCDIPNYDINANINLKTIIDQCKNIKY